MPKQTLAQENARLKAELQQLKKQVAHQSGNQKSQEWETNLKALCTSKPKLVKAMIQDHYGDTAGTDQNLYDIAHHRATQVGGEKFVNALKARAK